MENLFKIPGKKSVEKRPLDKLLSEDLGFFPFLTNQIILPETECVKCTLKIQNPIELVCFLKMNLNPVVADVEETSNDCDFN